MAFEVDGGQFGVGDAFAGLICPGMECGADGQPGLRNYRLRYPADGELESLMRKSVPSSKYELALTNVFECPGDCSWRVLVISAGPHTLARMLAMLPK